jgi:formylglycine-generating enzyme required for sulfatase activity
MKAVIPMLVAQCAPGTIPPQWDVLQRYDATQDYDAALGGVLRALGLSLPVQPAPAQAAPPTYRELNDRLFQQHSEYRRQEQVGTPPIPPARFPQRLANLGFTAHSDKGVDYILPPICTVPAGPFLMGSDPKQDEGAWDNEQPQHTVTLPTYDIARFPVTVAEYACFVRAGHPEPKPIRFLGDVDWQAQVKHLDHPIVSVTWQDAVDYAYWLSVRTSQSWWRLPTEAEWEKAARGTDGRIYPWGDLFDKAHCNTKESDIVATTPVGSYPSGASPYGVQDMAGNVCEWTSSQFRRYPYNIADGREDADSTCNRVLRGGSWDNDAGLARAAFRADTPSGYFLDNNGFRLVRAAPTS